MKKIFFAPVLAALLLSSCAKDNSIPAAQKGKTYHLTVTAEKAPMGDDDDSKVAYDWAANKMSFEADDQVEIIMGTIANGKVTSRNTVRLPMKEGSNGTFTGDITLPEGYALTDIRAAILVKEATPASVAYLGNSGTTIVLKESNAQTQTAEGVFSDATGRFLIYAPIAESAITQNGDNIHIDDLEFIHCDTIWEWHVYGEGLSGENVQKIEVVANGTSGAANILAATSHSFNISTGSHYGLGSPYSFSSSITLDTPFSVPAAKADAGVVWQNVYGANGTKKKTLKSITVVTDKAEYTRESVNSLSSVEKKVQRIYLNLSNFTRTVNAEYSIDGGTTWAEDLPSVTTATNLLVRGPKVTKKNMQDIDTFIRQQSSTVALDMSGATSETTEFPRVFGDTESASNANKKLKSIVIPYNITTVEAFCFRGCSELISVNMENLVELSASAFQGCGKLPSANLPKCTALKGNYNFSACNKLETVNIPLVTTIGASGVNSYAFFNCYKLTTVELPKITTCGHYIFQNCTSLTNVVIGSSESGDIRLGSLMFQGCTSLAEVTCHATKLPTFGGVTKDLVRKCNTTSTIKKLYVPASALDAYKASSEWSQVETVSGWTIEAIPE